MTANLQHFKGIDSDVASTGALDILDRGLVDDARNIATRFGTAEPFPHVVLDGFLEPGYASRLLEEFPAFERGNSIGDDGRRGAKSTFDRIAKLGPCFRQLDETIKSHAFLSLLGEMTGIPALIYDPFYLGGGTHENREGASLAPHIDFNYHPSERWHRRLNLLLYLNREWDPAWGGSLQLYRDPHLDRSPAVSVTPAFNRCVIFETSERSWHGFDGIGLPTAFREKTRKSVALYFYTRDRPASETAERHSTIYVQRPLAERFRMGHVLTASDVDELHAMIAARDELIARQHAENARLLSAQDKGLAGQILYLMKRAYVRFRR